MRASHWFGWLLIASLIIGCANPQPPAPQDPYAVYRPALLEAYQEDLDGLPTVPQYKLSLQVDFDARTLRGEGSVLVPNPHAIPLSELYFRLYPNLPQYQGFLRIDTVSVAGKLASFDYAPDETSLHLLLDEPLPPEQTIEVQYTWQVKAPSIPSGYILFGESQGILTLPLSYPVLAVSEMGTTGQRLNWHLEIAPPFSDVAFTESALYQVAVTTEPGMTVIGSGTVISRTTAVQGQTTWRFVTGPAREFILILSRELQRVSGRAYDTVVHSYFLPEDREAGQRALSYAIAAVQIYGDRFGRYPFSELSVVEAPLEYRGMEYPTLNLIGIDTYRQRSADMEFLIAHEIAHQWWYNLVGNDQVNRPWLDEGLAEYSTYIYYESIYGQEVAERLRYNRWEIPLNYARDNGLDAIVGQPAFGFGPGNYETMVYAKSALFFHALRQEMGDSAFFQLLRTLTDRYRYQVLTPEALLQEAQRISGKDLQPLYQAWILTAQKL